MTAHHFPAKGNDHLFLPLGKSYHRAAWVSKRHRAYHSVHSTDPFTPQALLSFQAPSYFIMQIHGSIFPYNPVSAPFAHPFHTLNVIKFVCKSVLKLWVLLFLSMLLSPNANRDLEQAVCLNIVFQTLGQLSAFLLYLQSTSTHNISSDVHRSLIYMSMACIVIHILFNLFYYIFLRYKT